MEKFFDLIKALRPGVQSGKISREQALAKLMQESGVSEEIADSAVTKMMPASGGITTLPEAEVLDVSFKPGMDKRGKVVEESPSQAPGIKRPIDELEKNMLNNTDYQNKKKAIDELENFTISDEDVVQNLVDQKFGKGYFDTVDDIPTKPDLDRPFVTKDEMSKFTLEDNERKLNKAKGFIDKLGAKTSRQKLFVADLVEDAGQGIFKDVDMGAVVRSNMFDDLIEQGIDDDLLTKIMYSDTKSDNFGTTLAKIKSNAKDEGVNIDETLDFYGKVFDEVVRVKKAMGGRIGFKDGVGRKGILSALKDKLNEIAPGSTAVGKTTKAVSDKAKRAEVERELTQDFNRFNKKFPAEGDSFKDRQARLINDYPILKDETKLQQAVDDIFPTGDYKYDAEMAADALVENNPDIFNDLLREDLPEELSSEIYGAVLRPITNKMATQMKLQRATRPEKTLASMNEGKGIDMSDPEIADEFGRFMKETDPEGYKELEQKVGVPSYKDKDKRLIPDDLEQESVDLAIAKGKFERKYSGLIDPELMQVVLNDPSLESVKKLDALMQEELIKSKRKLNASGGLNYLMGM